MVWFVSAAWRRYPVTRLCLAQRAHLCGELAGRGIPATCVVVADDDNLDIAREHGFHTVEQSNEHLGRKFNDGIQYACEHGAEYVVLIGSDDWMHVSLFDRLPAAAAEIPELGPDVPFYVARPSAEVITGRDIALVDLDRGRLLRCRSKGRYGVIPWLVNRRALEPSRYRPVNETANRGIDGSFIAGLRTRPVWVFTDPHEFCRVDFKTATNLTPYTRMLNTPGVPQGQEEPDPWTLLGEHYPAHLVQMARTVHETQAAA